MTGVREELAAGFEALAASEIQGRTKVLKSKGGPARTLRTDTGKVVTHGQVLQGLIKQAEIELEVQDGKRPKFVLCERCKRRIEVKPGHIPMRCAACKACKQCGSRMSRPTATGLCGKCITPEQRRALCRKAAAKANEAITPEQRRENGRKGACAAQPEQRQESLRKAMASLTLEHRKAFGRRGGVASGQSRRRKGRG